MGNITMNGQTIFEQVGTNRPTVGAGFPAGHILQVVHADRTGSANYAITSTDVVSADLNTGPITQKQTGSKIMVIATVTQAPTGYTTSYWRSGYIGFNTSSSGTYSGITTAYLGKAANSIADMDYKLYPQTVASWLIDTPSANFTIYLTANAAITSNYYIGGRSYYTALTVYEISQ